MVATFGQLKAFNAVARAGSITRAAHRLAVSQPAITAQIRRLEADHDTILFERTATGIQLTPMGRRLFRITRNLDDLEEAAGILLGGGDDPIPQVLRVATASPRVFMPVIAAYARQFPDVELDVTVGTAGDAVRRVLDRDADIALAPMLREDDRLEHAVFRRHRLTVLLPRDHAMAAQESLSLRDVVEEPMIMRRGGPSTTQIAAEQALAMHGLRVRPVLKLETREGVLEAVANGFGLALVLEHDIPPDPRLRVVPLNDYDGTTEECLLWLRSRRSMPLIRDFATVAETLSDTPRPRLAREA
ncbi:LysR family transcriptional regulator [Roseospira marina]|uniref:LysR family transcriptional regulator n=1 Tax=Roseospira marina TaxID=140057 RepID=A0A5M6IBP6_9PROT|nr:LysR substrate-binding domain-containing protein [Roseospira marina]KAA5605377.1 LysR family transcriptional regulator [Roseospira marina]MBB4314637.1 DNA-binding transcriptional LysR family regulator [Roseospira marina]MBB5088758.1 DNA-binding transcriptional LysR family regulator [Roseospira marina]